MFQDILLLIARLRAPPAITPRFAAVAAFTLADAKEYVATHPLPLGADRDSKPQVTQGEFLTSQQVSERLHGVTTGFPANHVLCYVELLRPFSFTGPQGALATYRRGVLIFDAQTDNLVISADSGGSRPRIRDDVAHHSDLISLGIPR
jgi:hypothetical protein